VTEAPRRQTRQRSAVLALLDDQEGFRTSQDLHALLRERGDAVGLATVYRALQALVDDGQVDVLRSADGEAAYRRCSPVHHHHLVCRSCGRTTDVDCAVGAAPCLIPSATGGFVVDEAEVVFWGLCAGCQAARRQGENTAGTAQRRGVGA